MFTATLALRFVFAILVLSSICMVQGQWGGGGLGGGFGGAGGIPRRTNRDPNPWSLTGPHPGVFETETYNIRFLPMYIKNCIRFSIVYFISLFTRVYPHRHQYLREVADSINGVIDCASHYWNDLLNLFFATYRFFASIPILGLVVFIPITIIRYIAFYPYLIATFCLNLCLGIFL